MSFNPLFLPSFAFQNMFRESVPLLPQVCPACGTKYFGAAAVDVHGHEKNVGITTPELLQCPLCSLSYHEATMEVNHNLTLLNHSLNRRKK